MRLILRQNESIVNEFQFPEGPVYIGRHRNSQVFLNHRAVSRQHAVMFQQEDGQWMIEDLDSANKTFLNDEAIHKVQIKTGDIIRIIDFTVEVNLEAAAESGKTVNMEDTLSKTAYDMDTQLAPPAREVVTRKPDAAHAPAVRLPAKRLMEFAEATEAISKAAHPDELLLTLLALTLEQFNANHTWCALRNQPAGPMTAHAGRGHDGKTLDLNEIKLNDKVKQALENGQYLLLPRVPAKIETEAKIRSALIVPIMRPAGCFGVLYVDNALDQEHYSLSDLDYLILLSIHTAAVLEKMLLS